MPKSKRRPSQAETESVSRAPPVSVDDAGASEVDDDNVEDLDNANDPEERASGREEESEGRESANDSAPDAADFGARLQAELTADTIQHYLNRISVKPLLTVEEEQRYSRLAKAGEFEARQAMIKGDTRLVWDIA